MQNHKKTYNAMK